MANCQVVFDCSMHSHVQRGNEKAANRYYQVGSATRAFTDWLFK